jgi:hypothetical protein
MLIILCKFSFYIFYIILRDFSLGQLGQLGQTQKRTPSPPLLRKACGVFYFTKCLLGQNWDKTGTKLGQNWDKTGTKTGAKTIKIPHPPYCERLVGCFTLPSAYWDT